MECRDIVTPMKVLATLRGKRFTYELVKDAEGMALVRVSGQRNEFFPLDHDKRHSRLFMSTTDQRRVGLEGLMALETMVREVLPRR